MDLFAAFAWLAGVLAAAWRRGYIPGAAVVVLFYLLMPLLNPHEVATNYNAVMRAILLAGISVLVSWIASVRRRSEGIRRTASEDLENRVAVRTAELAATRGWLQTTLASIGDAGVATNAVARVTFMNPVAANLTGWSERTAIGKLSAK